MKNFKKLLNLLDLGRFDSAKKLISQYPYLVNLYNESGHGAAYYGMKGGIDFISFLHDMNCRFDELDASGSSLMFEADLSASDEVKALLETYGAKYTPDEEIQNIVRNKDASPQDLEPILQANPQLWSDEKIWLRIVNANPCMTEHELACLKIMAKYIDFTRPFFSHSVMMWRNIWSYFPITNKYDNPVVYEAAEFFIQLGVKMFPMDELCAAIQCGDIEDMEDVLNRNPELIHYADPLTEAVKAFPDILVTNDELDAKCVECVNFLIQRGACVNAPDQALRQTALFGAIRNLAAETLLKHGADANVVDRHNRIPLHWICGFGGIDFVDFPEAIIKATKNINHLDEYGKTPLDMMRYGATPVTFRKMKQFGAKYAKELKKNTPL